MAFRKVLSICHQGFVGVSRVLPCILEIPAEILKNAMMENPGLSSKSRLILRKLGEYREHPLLLYVF